MPRDRRNWRKALFNLVIGRLPLGLCSYFASRAVTAHHASAECFRRAVQPGTTPALQTHLTSTAMALSRLSSQLIKALAQSPAEAFAMPGADALAAFGEFNRNKAGQAPSRPRPAHPAAQVNPAVVLAARPDLPMQAIMAEAGFTNGKFAAEQPIPGRAAAPDRPSEPETDAARDRLSQTGQNRRSKIVITSPGCTKVCRTALPSIAWPAPGIVRTTDA